MRIKQLRDSLTNHLKVHGDGEIYFCARNVAGDLLDIDFIGKKIFKEDGRILYVLSDKINQKFLQDILKDKEEKSE